MCMMPKGLKNPEKKVKTLCKFFSAFVNKTGEISKNRRSCGSFKPVLLLGISSSICVIYFVPGNLTYHFPPHPLHPNPKRRQWNPAKMFFQIKS